MSEIDIKLARLRELMAQKKLDAVILQRNSSFAWITCGAPSYINTASTTGVAAAVVTLSDRYIVTNNIEAPRLEREEGLAAQGWKLHASRWYETKDLAAELTAGLEVGSDGLMPGTANLANEITLLRASLTAVEAERFRALGRLCGEAMDSAIRGVRPGDTEFEIAGRLDRATFARGVQPIVNLIATDNRIFEFRHPLPTNKQMEKYAMLVLCGRKSGLVASITRLVHFGKLPDELKRKADACMRVDAAYIAGSKPGRTVADAFKKGVDAYAAAGFPDEWQLHHQGGLTGYEPREILGRPGANAVVAVDQAYAWNPSIAGVKSEDTVLVTEAGHEVITQIDGWDTQLIVVDGEPVVRPRVLEII
ncbi:MAG TPA: M24 family metallopeptidase [Thermoflexales bacterium]|nr:aminopeptidase P family protein [Anaerolineae bacterium]HQV27667.1 M24 family metallopeptidase [Thermoflexales bacterium]HQX10563.1 M24 family metallopeptidase [Thermoflexales bacterium]HQZ53276.1 M24 family metallopeptidase [Thermoflexales bacterium]HRA53291.1 M24 family metallopeptidase [Thermoflexales bacterium]